MNIKSVAEERKRKVQNFILENKNEEEELQDFSFDEDVFEEEEKIEKALRLKRKGTVTENRSYKDERRGGKNVHRKKKTVSWDVQKK